MTPNFKQPLKSSHPPLPVACRSYAHLAWPQPLHNGCLRSWLRMTNAIQIILRALPRLICILLKLFSYRTQPSLVSRIQVLVSLIAVRSFLLIQVGLELPGTDMLLLCIATVFKPSLPCPCRSCCMTMDPQRQPQTPTFTTFKLDHDSTLPMSGTVWVFLAVAICKQSSSTFTTTRDFWKAEISMKISKHQNQRKALCNMT